MKINTQRLVGGLLLVTMFTACSRPVAYFQKSQREGFAKAPVATVASSEVASSPTVETPTPSVAALAQQVAQANAALDQMDALVRNDNKLAADKSLQKRLGRVRTMLASASTNTALKSTAANTSHKANFMERMVLKKMNKKINKQLAPNNPNKAMANTGVLAAGAVLVIVSLILLLTGASSTLGVILLLAGAVILLVGLL